MEWVDLLGTPFKRFGRSREEGMCCATVSEEILRRCGHAFSPTHVLLPESVEAALDVFWASGELDYAAAISRGYERLGESPWDANRVGDLVLSSCEHGGGSLYVLVEPDKGTFLTSSHRRGVVSVPRRAIRNVVGAYRLGGDR